MTKILLIEDSDTDAFIVERAIRDKMSDVEYVRAASLTEGESMLEKEEGRADVVLLDLNLPDSNSPADTYTHIKKWADDVAIVVMTSLNDHKLAISLVKNGAEDYLSKDLMLSDPAHVCDAIDFAMERHALYKKMAQEKDKAKDEAEQKDSMIRCFMGGYSVS